MNNLNYEFSPQLELAVSMGVSGLDIVHGELKNLMLECEQVLIPLLENSNALGSDESYDDTVSRLYNEGYMDALTTVYQLTYDLSFAIAERNKNA
jgi:hypothetical protein